MFHLPTKTIVNKKIAKQKFYDNISLSSEVKRSFIDDVEMINWKYKLADTTLNVSEGNSVKEIQIFEIKLSNPIINESILRVIDSGIPYHILFLLEYRDKFQLWIGYKEKTNNTKVFFKVNRYYHTAWINQEDIQIKITTSNLEEIYSDFIRQIAGGNLEKIERENISESIKRSDEIIYIEKQIHLLQKKISKEKQFNKQVELNSQLKELKRNLSNLTEKIKKS